MKKILSVLLTVILFSFTNHKFVPNASAGPDRYIILATSSTSLDGSGSTGTGLTYQWTKLSGTGGTIVSATSATTNVTGLSGGAYVYELAVTESAVTDRDTVNVFVLPSNTWSYNSSIWTIYQDSQGYGVVSYARVIKNSRGQVLRYATSDGQLLNPSTYLIKPF